MSRIGLTGQGAKPVLVDRWQALVGTGTPGVDYVQGDHWLTRWRCPVCGYQWARDDWADDVACPVCEGKPS